MSSSSRVLVAVAVLALATSTALAGCGGAGDPAGSSGSSGSSLSADERTAADNLAAQIVRSGSMAGRSSGSTVTDEQATCIGEGAVTEVGLAELQGYGIVTEELLVDRSIQGVEMKKDDADALAGVFVDCIDAEALFEDRFLAGLPPGGSDEERRTCVEQAVDGAAVQEILSASFQGGSTPAYGELQRAVAACGDGRNPEQ